jgi:hypothetical protein
MTLNGLGWRAPISKSRIVVALTLAVESFERPAQQLASLSDLIGGDHHFPSLSLIPSLL